MREAFDMMMFVDAVYLLTTGTTLAVVGWCWTAMVRAERRREQARGK
jgi:hypothetical protein